MLNVLRPRLYRTFVCVLCSRYRERTCGYRPLWQPKNIAVCCARLSYQRLFTVAFFICASFLAACAESFRPALARPKEKTTLGKEMAAFLILSCWFWSIHTHGSPAVHTTKRDAYVGIHTAVQSIAFHPHSAAGNTTQRSQPTAATSSGIRRSPKMRTDTVCIAIKRGACFHCPPRRRRRKSKSQHAFRFRLLPACRVCTLVTCAAPAPVQFFDAFNPTSKTKRRAAFVKEMMRGAANALAFMHEAGVVHRSLGAPSLRVNTLGAWCLVLRNESGTACSR